MKLLLRLNLQQIFECVNKCEPSCSGLVPLFRNAVPRAPGLVGEVVEAQRVDHDGLPSERFNRHDILEDVERDHASPAIPNIPDVIYLEVL